MQAYIPVVLLALLIVAPRRGGRPVSSSAKLLALFVLLFGAVVVALGSAWNALLAPSR